MKITQIREMVREELKTQVMTESSSNEHLEEGFFNRIIAALAGISYGFSIGTFPGILTVAIAGTPIGVAAGGAGSVIGGIAGAAWLGRKLYRMAVRADPSQAIKEYEELMKIAQARDELLIELSENPKQQATLEPRIARLTDDQIRQAAQLDKALQRERKAGKTQDEEYESLSKIVHVASTGALTYLKEEKSKPKRRITGDVNW